MKRQFYIYCTMTVSLFLITCGKDHGVEPQKSGFQGVITFTGQWPAAAEEVRIVSSEKFPPTAITDLNLGESIPTDVDSYPYTEFIDPGTYKIVGVIWREKNAVWDFSSICGLYFTGTDSLVPAEVIVGPGVQRCYPARNTVRGLYHQSIPWKVCRYRYYFFQSR